VGLRSGEVWICLLEMRSAPTAVTMTYDYFGMKTPSLMEARSGPVSAVLHYQFRSPFLSLVSDATRRILFTPFTYDYT
jgi:hypothetical protein